MIRDNSSAGSTPFTWPKGSDAGMQDQQALLDSGLRVLHEVLSIQAAS